MEGRIVVNVTAEDLGSGIEYVEFNTDGTGAWSDYDAPYLMPWNLNDTTLGSHFIIVEVRDNAGNTVTKTHYFTVVDTISPVLDSPDDVEFTVGETGYTIDWDPTDIRPASFEVFVEGVRTFTGVWNASSEHIVVELDGLSVGTYNYTCVVFDDAGNSVFDTVIVTVNELPTTSTATTPSVTITTMTTETTTETTSTSLSTTSTTQPTSSTSSTPPPGGDMTMILILVGAGGVLVIIIVIVLMKKRS
jgi:hypothetical protein